MSKADAFTQAGKTAVLQNIQGTLQFLQRFPPFNQMEHAHLAYLVEQCQLRFYGQGESIIKPADGPVEHFYIVKQGRIVNMIISVCNHKTKQICHFIIGLKAPT